MSGKITLPDKKVQQRIAFFNEIRDIPFAIIPSLFDPVVGPKKMMNIGKGSCSPKHFLLGALFKKQGLKVRYVSYEFKFSDLCVNYPPVLRKLAKVLLNEYHLALNVFIDGKWILVDATWDQKLQKFGFPINYWDGCSNTINAIKPLNKVVHTTPLDRIEFITKKKQSRTPRQLSLTKFFFEELNGWLEEARK